MKNLLYLFLIGILFSCGGEGEDNEPNPEPKEYIVSLGMVGEIVDMEEIPMSKASDETTEIYGVQVYEFMGATYEPYAYGVFDDVSKMKVRLLEEHKYRIEATMLPNPPNYTPFFTNKTTFNIDNVFYITDKTYLPKLGVGNMVLPAEGGLNKEYERPNADRYYGMKEYTPDGSNSVNIEMKRPVFGVKVIVENAWDGSIDLKLEGSPKISKDCNNEKQTVIEDIFTFATLGTHDDYSESINISVTWNKKDGESTTPVSIMNQKVSFKRKKITVITIRINDLDPSSNPSLSLKKEEGDLIEGDKIDIVF